MELTASQRAAVEHRAGNLLVSASAGSGKTEVLARRCVDLVTDERAPCAVDQLLVVTFTRAAAAELRARIRRMLQERAGAAESRKLRDHIARQIVLIDTADISTIDAWCGRIVREHFDAVPEAVDPVFTTLGEEQARLLRHEVADALFERIFTVEDDEWFAEARAWMRHNARPDDGFLRQLVLDLNAYREHLINPDAWGTRQVQALSGDERTLRMAAHEHVLAAVRDECAFQLAQLDTILRLVRSPGVREKIEIYRRTLEAWAVMCEDPAQRGDVLEEIGAFRFPAKVKKDESADEAVRAEIKKRWYEKRLKERWSGTRVQNSIDHAPLAARYARILLGLEQRYRELLRTRKRQRGAYEFGDILRMTLDLLGTPNDAGGRDPTAIALRLRERYAHILVDEYQDTSPVQVELFRLVSREPPETPNRFLVGDVKQSIYGFREAEPRLFSALVTAFAANRDAGRVQLLADNFRSQQHLIGGLNRLFAGLFELALGGADFDEREFLEARRDDVPNPTLDVRPRIEVHLANDSSDAAEDDSDELEAIEQIEREAWLAAERIHALLRANTQVPERQPDGGVTLRDLRWSDIVILLRSAKHRAGLLATTLRKAGVPAVAVGRESLLDAQEVADARNLLRLVANREQDIPLAAALRGPLAWLAPHELAAIREAAPSESFHRAVRAYTANGEDAALRGKLADALERIEDWRQEARYREPADVLRDVLRATHLSEFARALLGGEHRVAALHAFVRFAERFAGEHGGGVAEFVEYLDELEARDLTPPVDVAGGDDVVRILTIHASKGLEFPVVFVLGAGAEFSRRPQRGQLRCDEARELGISFVDLPERKKLVSAAYLTNENALRERELEEDLRLLYVAATRARELLVFVGHAAPDCWETHAARWRGAGRPALITRLGARHMLDWLLMATAAANLDQPRDGQPAAILVSTSNDAVESDGGAARRDDGTSAGGGSKTDHESSGALSAEPVLSPADAEWVAQAVAWQEVAAAERRVEQPAVVSVSALKKAAPDAEEPPTVVDFGADRFRAPAFAAREERVDGRVLGDVTHRFLEHADLLRLDVVEHVQAQIEEQRAAGLLSDEEARLVPIDAIAWFGGSEIGGHLARNAAHVRREVPFSFALPAESDADRTLLRGVIDVLVVEDDACEIVDYKTDRMTDDADRARRHAAYCRQLQIYAHVASRIFARPVRRATLVYLRERRVEPVGLDAASMAEVLVAGAPRMSC